MQNKPFRPKLTTAFFNTVIGFALISCGPVPQVPGTPEPSASIAPFAYELTLQGPNQAISQGKIRLSHPLLGSKTLNLSASGSVNLSLQTPGISYLLEAEISGYLPLRKWFTLPEEGQYRQILVLTPAQASLTGQVLDSQNRPIFQALISRNGQSTLSDQNGYFQLPQTQGETGPVNITKQGYLPFTGNQTERYLLNAQSQPKRLRTYSIPWPHTQLLSATQQAGYTHQIWDTDPLDPSRDLLWLACPQNLNDTQHQEIQNFVSTGGKLLVSGEWAGFGDCDPVSQRRILSPWGLAPGEDQLGSSASPSLVIESFQSHALTQGIQRLVLYRSGSVRSLDAAHTALLASSHQGVYRILATPRGGDAVLGVATKGMGKVIALGDSSLWLDQDSDGDGLSNFASADHAKLWKAILAW